MIRIDCEQRSSEWFAARLGLVTASCFGSVLATIKSGEAAERRNYRARLVVERLTGRSVDSFESQSMRDGAEREPLARAAYEAKTGGWVEEVGLFRHESMDAACSPDGLLDDDGCIEIKAPSLATHLEYLRLPSEACPAKYVPQVQGQLWLTERRFCDFVSFNPDFPERLQLVIRRVRRDDLYIAKLSAAVALFAAEVAAEAAELLALPVAA